MFSRLRRLLGSDPLPAPAPPPRPASPPAPPDAPHSGGHLIQNELLLYKYDACPYCRRVQLRIAELGISVPMRDTRREPGAQAELVARAGRGQVPCLFIDGQPLFESEDIIRWLERAATKAKNP